MFFLVCSEGYYGPNCAEMCSNNSGVPKKCDRKTGECIDGCQIGWKKPLCKKRKHWWYLCNVPYYATFIAMISFFIQDTYKLKIHHIVQLNCLLKQGVMLVYLVKIAWRSAGNALRKMLVTMWMERVWMVVIRATRVWIALKVTNKLTCILYHEWTKFLSSMKITLLLISNVFPSLIHFQILVITRFVFPHIHFYKAYWSLPSPKKKVHVWVFEHDSLVMLFITYQLMCL